ncbi:uncharacterized protein LOC127800159 isoform X2 [Diospyros lotus]|uniref:uncharacterized protein LOC127800159 isoform X2 n=1 Tax=Diospyros lotus TaxID=55363 RepID=UPI0022562717|nr:uncharacterized protein LOC127800159 isoform X2 [Diospyros lotus]
MGKVSTAEMRKKKKGRPSLSDLQKRNLKQLPDQPEEQHPETLIASGPNFNTPPRRSTRRNPSLNGTTPPSGADRVSHDEDEDEDDDEDERKEKKVKLVVRLPHSNHHYSHPRSSAANSLSLNSASCGSDSNADGDNHDVPLNNPKINAAGVGSGDQLEKVQKAMDTLHGSQLETGPTTPLPDKKFLVFILDRLQKKDTYGVFSEPVDPNELPDYHEIIEHPMDFGTVRRKLEDGHYPNLDEFEADVSLICTNAMLYNAPDTIYYRQARSIKDLAKRDFENLRQVNDDGEPEPKIVRRGRPPSKNLKKSVGSPPFERVGPESSSDATLATVGDNAIGSNSYNLRKAPMPFRFRSDDSLFRAAHQSRNSETGTDWLSEWNSEFPASVLKAEAKYGKKQFPLDENRRATYKQFHPSAFAHDPSALTTLNGDIKQLMGVGVHSEHGYARSLARFAANLGPVAWKIASRKIEHVLPPGVKFGPGWVGDDGVSSRSPSALQEQKYSNNLVHDAHPQERVEGVSGHNSNNESDVSKSGFGGISPGPSFQTQQKLILQPHRSGFNGVSGYDLSSQMGMVRGRLPLSTGQSGLEEASVPSQMLGVVPRGNTSLTPPSVPNHIIPESNLPGNSNSTHENIATRVTAPNSRAAAAPEVAWQGFSSQQQKQYSHPVPPPDLNVRFQAPGSPRSSSRNMGSPQHPDLALQL